MDEWLLLHERPGNDLDEICSGSEDYVKMRYFDEVEKYRDEEADIYLEAPDGTQYAYNRNTKQWDEVLSMAGLADDPEFRRIAEELGKIVNGGAVVAYRQASARAALSAREKFDTAGPLGLAIVNVLDLAVRWALDDPYDPKVDQLREAVEAGINGERIQAP